MLVMSALEMRTHIFNARASFLYDRIYGVYGGSTIIFFEFFPEGGMP